MTQCYQTGSWVQSGQGTISHMLQLKIPQAVKTQYSQKINILKECAPNYVVYAKFSGAKSSYIQLPSARPLDCIGITQCPLFPKLDSSKLTCDLAWLLESRKIEGPC